MTILAIDTSTKQGDVVLMKDGAVLFSEQFIADRTHSAKLFSVVKRALSTGTKCDRIVVGLGPGSYAGVRIAAAAAYGLRHGLNAELVGIPSVAAYECETNIYAAIGDARRQSFYFSEIIDRTYIGEPLLLNKEELIAKTASYPHPVYCSDQIPFIPDAEQKFPSAKILAQLGAKATSSMTLQPIYLRPPHITYPNAKDPR